MTTVIRSASARKYDPLAARKRLTDRYRKGNRAAAQIIATDPQYAGGLLADWAERTLANERLYAVSRRVGVLLETETGLNPGQLRLLSDRGGASWPL